MEKLAPFSTRAITTTVANIYSGIELMKINEINLYAHF